LPGILSFGYWHDASKTPPPIDSSCGAGAIVIHRHNVGKWLRWVPWPMRQRPFRLVIKLLSCHCQEWFGQKQSAFQLTGDKFALLSPGHPFTLSLLHPVKNKSPLGHTFPQLVTITARFCYCGRLLRIVTILARRVSCAVSLQHRQATKHTQGSIENLSVRENFSRGEIHENTGVNLLSNGRQFRPGRSLRAAAGGRWGQCRHCRSQPGSW